jgi:hypothetical protein
MGKLILLILSLTFFGILCAVPFWAVVNLFMLVFHLPYHLTLLQAVVVCALLNILHELLFSNNKED